MISAAQRKQLAEFLRSCRARLSPVQVGLPEPSRRRRPGLRREEVAALARVSITWYSWLEQGRDVQASVRMLETLSRVLQLSPEEREYLFALAQNRSAPVAPARSDGVGPAVQRMLDGLSVPALVMTLRWDVVAWNRLVTLLFRDYGVMEPEERNLVRILLTSPAYQADAEEYDRIAHRVVAKLRIDYSQSGGDPAFDALVEEMSAACPKFRELWHTPEIVGRAYGTQVVIHPQLGEITLEHTSYVVEGSPNLRALIFVPVGAESAAKVAWLVDREMPPATWTAPAERREYRN